MFEKKDDRKLRRPKDNMKPNVEAAMPNPQPKNKANAPTRGRDSSVLGIKSLDTLFHNIQVKAMIMLDNGEIERLNLSDDEMPPLLGGSENEVKQLVTRRALNIQPKEYGTICKGSISFTLDSSSTTRYGV